MNQNKWVAVWGNAMSIATHTPESYAKNITLRYPIDVPFDGEAMRLTFDNYCGTEPIRITRATVATADSAYNSYKDLSCPVIPEEIADITFHGRRDVTADAHERVVSDPIPFRTKGGTTVCISIYLEDFTLMQSSVLITGALSKGFFSFGDQTHVSHLPIETTKTTNWFYFLSDVDILASPENHAIVCYGDSITAQDWPDELKLRLRKMGASHTSVIRKAASGTRVLREYSCITYDSYGLKGKNRFHHELPVAGADTLIIQQGINDIIHPVGSDVNIFRPMSDLPTAEELEKGLEWYLEEAEKMGIRTYIGTLLPIYGWRTYAPFREELRADVNNWIRRCPHNAGCIDFDKSVRNTDHPEAFAEGFDSGDHLHPSKSAYTQMAYAICEDLLY